MPKFKVRFVLDSEPAEIVTEYIFEAQWEEDAISEAERKWKVDFPEKAAQRYTSGCETV